MSLGQPSHVPAAFGFEHDCSPPSQDVFLAVDGSVISNHTYLVGCECRVDFSLRIGRCMDSNLVQDVFFNLNEFRI
jgi:hypothetical protein